MISNLDDDINERVHHCFKRWGVNYHIIDEERPPNGRTKTLRSHSMVLTHLFLKLFGTGSHLKRVAPELLAAPPGFRDRPSRRLLPAAGSRRSEYVGNCRRQHSNGAARGFAYGKHQFRAAVRHRQINRPHHRRSAA